MFLKMSTWSVLEHFNLMGICVSTSLLFKASVEVRTASSELQATVVA